jgi:hypothetical protein
MYTLDLKSTIHNFEKVNLITELDRFGQYDLYQCTKCGLKGKLRTLGGVINIDSRFSESKIKNCDNSYQIPKSIKIIKCGAFGKQFRNIVRGTIHEVIEPPKGYRNDGTGVWVMGVSEPVKILTSEFVEI